MCGVYVGFDVALGKDWVGVERVFEILVAGGAVDVAETAQTNGLTTTTLIEGAEGRVVVDAVDGRASRSIICSCRRT